MKTKLKSIIAAAIACVAVVSQAEGYKWRLDTSEYMKTPAKEWYSGDAYVFAAGTQQDVLDAFFAGTDISTLAVEGSSLYINEGETFEPFPLFQYGTVGQNNSAFFAAILTEGGKDYVFISEEASVMNPATGNGQYEFLSEVACAKVFESTTYSAAGYYTQAVTPPPSVTINEVKSVEPWVSATGTITVDYSLGGLDAAKEYKVAFDITANGVTKGVTNAAAKLTSGPQTVFTYDTVPLFGAETRAEDAQVKVSLIAIKPKLGGFQLWEGGPIFAECNVGATKPEDAGYYFWWGDTVGYTHDGEKWVSADGKGTSIKFSNEPPANTLCVNDAALADYVDANGNLKSDYDAATAHLGAPWRMMTKAEMDELAKCPRTAINTQGEEFKNNGDTFAGWRIKGKEDYSSNSIFLPATGYGDGSDFNSSVSRYLTATPSSTNFQNVQSINLSSNAISPSSSKRYNGHAVRAVRDAK